MHFLSRILARSYRALFKFPMHSSLGIMVLFVFFSLLVRSTGLVECLRFLSGSCPKVFSFLLFLEKYSR